MKIHPSFLNIVDSYPGCKLLSVLIETDGGAHIFVQPMALQKERRTGVKDRRRVEEPDEHPAGRRKFIDRRRS